MKFIEKWLEVVEEKNSVLCAGLDPAEQKMGRGDKGLPEKTNKMSWALKYVEAVAPYCAAIKPNFQYWKDEDDIRTLKAINELAHDLGMVVIDDSKLADIGSTNEAGMFYAKQRADAVTLAPYAGNMAEAAEQAKKLDFGLITMCLMSNKEYEREKNKLVQVTDETGIDPVDLIEFDGKKYLKQYMSLANDADAFKLDGIVIGAPSEKNHISDEEIEKARGYVSSSMLVLLPGVGAQGGEAGAIWKHFGRDNVIVNVGRGLMFPNGSGSTPKEQAETAKQYQKMLNDLRG